MTEKRYNLKKHNDKWYIDKDGEALTNVDYLLKHDVEVICNELNNLANENEQLQKRIQELEIGENEIILKQETTINQLIKENEQLKKEVAKLTIELGVLKQIKPLRKLPKELKIIKID